MSILSAERDWLRDLARRVREGEALGERDATEIERAADDLWTLRNKLNDAYDALDDERERSAELLRELQAG